MAAAQQQAIDVVHELATIHLEDDACNVESRSELVRVDVVEAPDANLPRLVNAVAKRHVCFSPSLHPVPLLKAPLPSLVHNSCLPSCFVLRTILSSSIISPFLLVLPRLFSFHVLYSALSSFLNSTFH